MDLWDIKNSFYIKIILGIFIILFIWGLTWGLFPNNSVVVKNETGSATTTTTLLNYTNQSMGETNLNPNIIRVYVNETVLINKTRFINVTNIINITEKIIEKLNISERQHFEIKNMKPDKCFNIGCSDGFHKCKEEVLDILEWVKPRFSERPSTGYDPLFNRKQNLSTATFVLEDRVYGQYITFDPYYWRLSYNINVTLWDELELRINDTEFNDTVEMRQFLRESLLNMSVVDNRTYVMRKIK